MRTLWIYGFALGLISSFSPAQPQSIPVDQEVAPLRPVVRQVQWPSEKEIAPDRLAMLPAVSLAEIAVSPVPVLLPESPDLMARALVTTGPHWFAASISEEGHSIAINATRVMYETAQIEEVPPPADRVRGIPARVSASEGILSVSWEEFGISYLLRIGCDTPENPRCANDDYLRAVAESLTFMGGAR